MMTALARLGTICEHVSNPRHGCRCIETVATQSRGAYKTTWSWWALCDLATALAPRTETHGEPRLPNRSIGHPHDFVPYWTVPRLARVFRQYRRSPIDIFG